MPRRRPRLVVAVIVIVIVVAALVGVGVWAWVTRDPGARPGWADNPRSAVQGYLTAVADGRAADALAYLDSQPSDRTFLTDAVLAQSHDLAPMTELTVGDASDPDGSDEKCTFDCVVQVEYRLGDEETAAELVVSEHNGYWFVDNQPRTVDFGSIYMYQADVLVNGTPLAAGANKAVLFPGRYHVTSGHPLVDLDDMFTVELPEAGGAAAGDPLDWRVGPDDLDVPLLPVLSSDGRQRVAEAAQDQLDACLAQTSFATECGFLGDDVAWLDGPADPTTITWTLAGDTTLPAPGDQLRGGIRNQFGLAVRVSIEIHPRCTWTTVAGQAAEREPDTPPNYYVADITDPDHITVAFAYSNH